MTESFILYLLKLFRRFRGISLYLLRKLYDHIIQNSIHTTMDFLQDITGALLETVEFNNDEREQLVETLMTKTAAVATSAVKFQTAIGEDADGGVFVSENFYYDSEIYNTKLYAFTDRPLYRPGDWVEVKILGRHFTSARDSAAPAAALPRRSAATR